MKRIGLLTPCVIDGDAVSNDVLGMYGVLSELGYDVRLFVDNCYVTDVAFSPSGEIAHFLRDPSSLLIYHFSIGWQKGIELLRTLKCRKVVKYHNVTPPSFFEGIDGDYACICRDGREQLSAIAQMDCSLYLADSDYNKRELVNEGAVDARCAVVPPFHHIERLHAADADLSVIDKYVDGLTNVLTVGRLAPNKGHLSLIDAFSAYHYGYNRKSRLLIVGKHDHRLGAYATSLFEKVDELGLREDVIFTDEVSASGLKAYYLVSDIFMVTSEHEGFCVPLVESMSLKIPIVAWGSSAVAETVGNAGLVWDNLDPYLLAGSVNYIMQHEPFRLALENRGWERFRKAFDNRRIREGFVESIRPLL